MLDEDVLIPLMFFLTVIVVSIGWPIARAFARRMDRRSLTSTVPTEVAQRLERMEQALDAMSIEIERISEGQRFTTKLLAERAAVPEALPQAGPARVPASPIPGGGQ